MKHSRLGFKAPGRSGLQALGIAVASSFLLSGCFDGDSSSGSDDTASDPLFPENGQLQATIRRTTNGVPHIKADDLSSAGFGAGYSQAQDNICLLAEAIVKARSERAKYFGPGYDVTFAPGQSVGFNIISDFSYKAQEIYSGAEEQFDSLSDESKALITGFSEGYNKYVVETDPSDFPEECRDQPWVKEITPVDLLAHYRIVGQYASGAQFATGVVFLAVPPAQSPAPRVVTEVSDSSRIDNLMQQVVDTARTSAGSKQNFQDTGLASNAWGVGREMTEQGRGALLANPHFPYTGHRRLYQMQMTVPGYLNVNGAGLLGTAVPLISFNEHLAWSHTVTTSRRFTWYELKLKQGDNLTYVKDGQEKPITSKTLRIEVDMGMVEPVTLEREFYYSEYGPMLAANAVSSKLPGWGSNGALTGAPAAYTYRDANADTPRLLDTWLQMSRASNLTEFQNVFKNCGSTLWTNSTYADDQGNAFYIDSSSVPNLSEKSIAIVNLFRSQNADYAELFDNGVTLLDGSSSVNDWVEGECEGLVPYEDKPKLLRADWVQNSNSSYWATNPDEFLTGYSPLFGSEESPINPRTRLGIKMLQNPLEHGLDPSTPAPAGQDGKFGAEDLIGVIWNNRAWYSEQFLDELLSRCGMIASTPVNVPDELLPAAPDLAGGTRTVADGCAALTNWNGTYDLDSTGAHTFRAFVDVYMRSFQNHLQTKFDPENPVYTPADPSPVDAGTENDPMLQSLAAGLVVLDAAGIDPAARLGDVQYYQPTGGVPPGGDPNAVVVQSAPIPWHGGDGNVDGAFNAIGVVDSDFAEDTIIPRENTPEFNSSEGVRFAAGVSANSGEGWKIARGTSWHFGLEFTDNGPEAYGLVSYSQSSDAMSPYFTDQSQLYSEKNYRKLLFTESEIMANLLPQGEVTISGK
ncbi:acylase [Marinobacter nanhaiticus D15-8W]|uniref:Penicillin acylase family protein n=1 Tax=Marinobacter nanhaiticus D15-8W TaxID=626887 RepID=N6WXL1_9GAMM|nr:penicillin acylase family protein [Marinobacter nanhaiticus]ENO13543.1 penicillin acylase family protein [Marinobacter nanhaiticus D15-8W]BES70912.1 acylase [Marinobacter nanhaiticus D15-8W]